MKQKIRTLLLKDQERFEAKGLFGSPGDSFSMRIPGQPEILLVTPDHHKPESVSINCPVIGLYRGEKLVNLLVLLPCHLLSPYPKLLVLQRRYILPLTLLFLQKATFLLLVLHCNKRD